MKRKWLPLLLIIIVSITSGVFVYERTVFDIKDFRFELEHGIHGSCTHEKMDTILTGALSRYDLEKALIDFGVSSLWVKDLSLEELTKYVMAKNIEKCTSFFKIMKNGEVEVVIPEEALNGKETSDCMYFQRNIFWFTTKGAVDFDRHCMVIEMNWLTEIKWSLKYEVAVGVLDSSFDMDTVKCGIYNFNHGTMEFMDLRDKAGPVGDAGYLGIRIVDDLAKNPDQGTLLIVQYEFSKINYTGDLLHYIAQFHCKRSSLCGGLFSTQVVLFRRGM